MPSPWRPDARSGPAPGRSGSGAGEDDLGTLPQTRTPNRWDRLWRPFWVLPMVVVLASVVSGYLLPSLDRSLGEHLPYFFTGGPSGARDLLGTIAGAMISVTGLVFSITMVVVQLASSQYSPRVLEDFLSSRITQLTLGIFAASFTYALTVLRAVQGESGEGGAFVPQVAVTVSFLLVLASVGMFLAFIHHITRSIQVSSVVSHLGDGTVRVVDEYFPETDAAAEVAGGRTWDPGPGRSATTVVARRHGAVVEVDHHGLVDWARERQVVVEVLAQVGAFVPDGAPALRVWRDRSAPALDQAELAIARDMVVLEQNRLLTQDPALGIRKLVDIGERALSASLNDPTTAVQALDELHRVLRLAVTRGDLPSVVMTGGVVRLVHRPQSVSQLLDLALTEPLYYGRHARQVPRRVVTLLEDLLEASLPHHRGHLMQWLARARATVRVSEEETPW